MKKYGDYNVKVKIDDIYNLSDFNVGQTYTIIAVNRTTREVTLNSYHPSHWEVAEKWINATPEELEKLIEEQNK